MKPAKAFILAGSVCALALAILCFAADGLFDGFENGVAGQHVGGWYDEDHTDPSSTASGVNVVFGTSPSTAEFVTTEGSTGYGESYREIIELDTSVYPYLHIKVDSVSNTATTWEVGINTFQYGDWNGMSHTPLRSAASDTGVFSLPVASAFASPGVHRFSISIVVSGVWEDPDWYGYDGDKVVVDYVRMSTTDEEEATPTPAGTNTPTPNPTATPTPVPKRGGNGGFTSSSAHSFFGWMRELFGY